VARETKEGKVLLEEVNRIGEYEVYITILQEVV
jgi:hypothetical protein